MTKSPELTYPDVVRIARAFLMIVMAEDAIALRPNRPRARSPLTSLAEKVFRILMFHFEDVLTGLCFPSIATLAKAAGCSDSSVKRFLPALYEAEFLTWRKGKRKRVKTRKGWRVVRSSNRYRILCPRRHLAALRRWLIKACGGRHIPLIEKVIARLTPPTEEAKAAEKIIETLTADLRPGASRSTPVSEPEHPARSPPGAAGPIEVGGIQVEDPGLGSVLSKLWAGLEKREQSEG